MRRKLFCVLLAAMTVLFFMDMAGIPLSADEMEGFIGSKRNYTAEITEIRAAGDGTYRLEARILEVDGRKVNIREKILLGYYEELKVPWKFLHSEMSFICTLEKPVGQRNPYCFDYGKYLKSRGIGAVGILDSFKLEDNRYTVKERYERWLFEKRCVFEAQLNQDTKGIIIGVLFGDTAYLEEDVYEDFRNNGTAHVLGVN